MIAVDVGNTFIKTAYFNAGEIAGINYVPTQTCIDEGGFFRLLPETYSDAGEAVAIVSVRKAALDIIARETFTKFGAGPFIVDADTDTGIRNLYLSKDTLGLDRLVTAAAAWKLYSEKNRPVIVVDMGTATTVDLVSKEGEFIGGLIVPGIKSALAGLLIAAPELPDVKIERIQTLIGRTTYECMSSGAMAAHAGMIRGVCEMIDPGAVVLITGGMAEAVLNWLPGRFIFDENLLMKGLKIIYDRNHNP